MVSELPVMNSSAYANTRFDPEAIAVGLGQQQQFQQVTRSFIEQQREYEQRHKPNREIKQMTATPRRLVQVFMLDPDENVPLDQALLYQSEQKLTDATDQELFYEIDIKTVLEKHNALRATLINKSVKERTEQLEPARIRDLRMTVVTIASF